LNVAWTFRKQPKFFDIVTWTGNDVSNRRLNHLLGSTPGCMFYKKTSNASNWGVWHRSMNANQNPWDSMYLNLPDSKSIITWFGDGASPAGPTSTQIVVNGGMNNGGDTYVAYLFAHDAGGFGLTGTDNVISCGSFTTDGSGAALVGPNLGWEPQWVLMKNSTSTGSGDWWIFDTMRGFTTNGGTNYLLANTSGAAGTFGGNTANLTSTGFTIPSNAFAPGQTFIYIAIRKGPMKVPTLGTSVFAPIARSGTGTNTTVTGVGFPPDAVWTGTRNAANGGGDFDRLRGKNKILFFAFNANAENGDYADQLTGFDVMDGFTVGPDTALNYINKSTLTYANWCFKRAPGFFDEVCYTGTSFDFSFRTHNLGVRPELVIVKKRSGTSNWAISQRVAANLWVKSSVTGGFVLNSSNSTADYGGYDFGFTATQFMPDLVGGTVEDTNTISATYVAYLFATCAGVSKVGTYNGNGTTQTIDCGFAGGARFVLIKRTDASGPWYAFDTARGMTVMTDPYLQLNTSGSAEVQTLGAVTTVATGFAVNNAILAGINAASPAAYIFLAIA
jgi:hypothetical protein